MSVANTAGPPTSSQTPKLFTGKVPLSASVTTPQALYTVSAGKTFYITDHYLNYPWVLVRLAIVDRDDLRDLLEESWRLSSPKHLRSAPNPKNKAAKSRKPPGRGA